MRNFRIILIVLFLVVAVAFSAFLAYDRAHVDHTAPMIVCDGVPLCVSVNATDRELCAGLTATDDVDGDITDRIVVQGRSRLVGGNTAVLSYAVFDSASNFCTYSREVSYTDYEKPRFALSAPLRYAVNDVVTIADRMTVTDVLDGDISDRIRLSSSAVDNTQVGEYPVSFQVSNSSGDIAVVTAVVQIVNTTMLDPQLELTDYLVYLPLNGELTQQMLEDYFLRGTSSRSGLELTAQDVTITGEVDTARRGSYSVCYSYTNNQNRTASVYLTVVVE